MLQSIKATNFQSLQNVEVEFGHFTVIVGASSSGKSALTRAVKAVASNSLDSDYITRGAKVSAVSLKTDVDTVTIEREQGGSSAYKIAKASGKESSFTSLNRQVPAEVTAALGITPDKKEVASINFAGQFDTPYLLKEGSSAVARVLGELTNVSTIFSAVREASKRAKNASSLVNLRKKDQDKLLVDLPKYVKVAQEAKTVSEAENILEQCLELQAQIQDLTRLKDQLAKAQSALQTIKGIPELPDVAELLKVQNNLSMFKATVRQLITARKTIKQSVSSITEAESAILLAENNLHDTLVKAGQCPTCNQKVL